MKEDEKQLLLKIRKERPLPPKGENKFATEYGDELGIHPKRTEYLLGKWTDRDWWEYGVTVRTGWLTEKGCKAADELS